MSAWTYVNGVVTVSPPGSGQRAMDFVLGEVLDHLPLVTGSEGPMHVEAVRRPGRDSSRNSDEFGQRSNLGSGAYGGRGSGIWFDEQGSYDLLLVGALRDRYAMQTLREFCGWMNRLSKRVRVEDALVRVSDCYGWSKVFDGAGQWCDNFERWSWQDGDVSSVRRWANWRYGMYPTEGNWTERLVNLVPSGKSVLERLDFAAGNLEWYEYGDTPDGLREAADEARRIMEVAEEVESDLRECAEWLEMSREDATPE